MRYEFQDEGNYVAYGLSMRPLPESDYLHKAERPPTPTLENGHEGAGATGAASSAGSGGAATAMAASAAMATAAKLCDASLPLPGSSARSSVASTASSSLSAGGPAAANAAVARKFSGTSGGGDFGGGGGGDFQPLPPLGVMHQRVGSLPLSQGRADAWGSSHDMGGGAVSAGDPGRGLDDSMNSSRGSMNGGGGGGEGFHDGIGAGGLDLDSGRGGGGISSGWARASSRGEVGLAGAL